MIETVKFSNPKQVPPRPTPKPTPRPTPKPTPRPTPKPTPAPPKREAPERYLPIEKPAIQPNRKGDPPGLSAQ